MTRDEIILLTGPVGGGKTTTAVALAGELRASGRRTAVIDLDLLYPMAGQGEPRYTDPATWRAVYRGAAGLAEGFIASGIDVVIVEGGFLTVDEIGWFRDGLTTDRPVRLVALDLSWDETRRRVDADASADRGVTRDERVLRWHYGQFTAALPFLHANGVVVDGENGSAEAIARSIVDACDRKRRPSQRLAARPLTEPAASRLPLDHADREVILAAHARAVEAGEDGYTDPATGLFVFTAAYHAARGVCCESGCRHCPYIEE